MLIKSNSMKTTLKQTIGMLLMLLVGINVSAGNWTNFSNFTSITQVAVNGNQVWVAAKGGLMVYDKNTGSRHFFKKGIGQLPSTSVERVAISPVGKSIWIGTYDNGIARYNGTTWEHHPFPLQDALLYEMKIASNGAVWCATSDGIYKYENNAFSRYWSPTLNNPWDIDLFPDGRVLCASNQPFIFNPNTNQWKVLTTTVFSYSAGTVYVKDDSTYYFCSDGGIVSQFNDTTQVDTFVTNEMILDLQTDATGALIGLSQFHTLLKIGNHQLDTIAIGDGYNSAFAVNAAGEVYAAGILDNGMPHNTGKLYYKNAQAQTTTVELRKSDINDNSIRRLRMADDGDILITHTVGVQKFNVVNNQFVEEWKLDTLNTNDASDAIQWHGKLYVSTFNNHLCEFSNGHWNTVGAGILPSKEVDHLAKDKDDNLWMAGPGYVAKYDGTNFTMFTTANSQAIAPNLYMRDIYCDSTHNTIWVATYNGILKYVNGTFTLLNDTNTAGIQQFYDAIETIKEDDAHNIWFGTIYGGMLKFDGTSFSTMLLPQHVGNQVVSGIEFENDTMYVGDNLNGVWVYANGQWDSLQTWNSGITDNYVSAMLKDRSGNIWISHLTYGLDAYNKNGLTVSKVEEIASLEAKVYPNPSTGKFLLETNEQSASIAIYSTTGNEVLQIKSVSNKTIIDLSAQARGLYFATISTANGTQTIKLVVQ